MKMICRILLLLTGITFLTVLCSSGIAAAESPSAKTVSAVKKSKKRSAAKKRKKGKTGKPRKAAVKPAVLKEAAAAPTLPEADSGPVAHVTDMRHWSNPDYTRIAVSLDRDAKFEFHQIPHEAGSDVPPRIYFDIESARVSPGVKDISIGDGLLRAARIGQYRPDTVRVVLDLGNIKDYKIFTFSDPYRIIVDVKGERPAEFSRGRGNVIEPLAVAPPKPELPAEKPVVPPRKIVGKIRRIVVDAGHGGHDPGATGAGGTREKDIVLGIALKLAGKLRDRLGLDVVLTRRTDVFLELQERTAIANQVGADLFVSIHANASLNRGTTGIETYYLNLAKTEKAAQLAAQENGTSLEKVSLLQAVLFDLMANYKLNDSALLAEEVQKSVCRKVGGAYPGVRNLGVKQGPFYVLVGATMPSILVETSFLSNDREEERLNDTRYQEQLAEGITDGIRDYVAAMK
jgi:N-acetylmuramoyl-L-alanine amidase